MDDVETIWVQSIRAKYPLSNIVEILNSLQRNQDIIILPAEDYSRNVNFDMVLLEPGQFVKAVLKASYQTKPIIVVLKFVEKNIWEFTAYIPNQRILLITNAHIAKRALQK